MENTIELPRQLTEEEITSISGAGLGDLSGVNILNAGIAGAKNGGGWGGAGLGALREFTKELAM